MSGFAGNSMPRATPAAIATICVAQFVVVLTASVASTQTGTDAADPAYRGVTSGVRNSAAQVGTVVGVAPLVPLAPAAGWAAMAGYRVGFLGAGAIALLGGLSSFLIPARPAFDREPASVGEST
jgi:hypothetical protein